jgi:CDP-glucose 4,6-dehydratase
MAAAAVNPDPKKPAKKGTGGGTESAKGAAGFDWRRSNVLLTGATGLLGSALLEKLLERGATVTCLVRDQVPQSRAIADGMLAKAQIVRGGLEDHEVVLRALNEYEIDTVLHAGAQTIVGTASRSPRSTWESNVRGTWNLLDACRECPKLIRRVVVASSDKAYGEHAQLPYTEEAPLRGRFPYDASKAAAELIASSYAASFGVPLAITRCGNLFGPGDLNWNRLVPGTIRSALRGERPIIRSDGKFVRDYFFVEDAALAYLTLAEKLHEPGVLGQAFNFGTETPLDVLGLVRRILTLMKRTDLEPVILNEASLEIPKQYLDCSKAKRVLGWKPRFTLDEGLAKTIEWYRKR